MARFLRRIVVNGRNVVVYLDRPPSPITIVRTCEVSEPTAWLLVDGQVAVGPYNAKGIGSKVRGGGPLRLVDYALRRSRRYPHGESYILEVGHAKSDVEPGSSD